MLNADELEHAGAAVSLDLMMLLDGVKRRIKAVPAAEYGDLAEECGVSVPTLYAIIADRRLPSLPTFQKLCNYFAITVDVATHKQVMPPVVKPNS
ncbi:MULTISPECIES: helix-turn-helix transcriptional regulator [Rhizobium]|uniref:Helix-turn-helix transcriptional regulator n=1 Tax=Rhizobium phaseoli TaxID=396 RepID=A0A7X6F3W9_9HYPH|nr:MULTISPECIES: helix-turn-helix transcriptional regulator [Rhizobium]ANL40402.1 helix-turn-helix domain-containing protein [Rhizobium phaseoli]ANL59390.1 helix-turn-helix domain-containing protein [Rhizobium phaseoli]MDE8761234.1 helix-turn-helix transcriptional regulator [Rhizobium sp. CBK13]NKF12953.1 helix-turn-helix transcriptional regulator [Rhizobium phaseoli]QPK10770.1 helix-turn-helix transcriptional regulator [Rhizobium phaseoli]